jgi:hypothetical protein
MSEEVSQHVRQQAITGIHFCRSVNERKMWVQNPATWFADLYPKELSHGH